MKPGGKLYITTPNTKRSLARNPFHIHEYTFDELTKEVAAQTKNFEVMGLNGNEKVRKYYEENGRFVRSILKWDVLGLHKILPAKLVSAPYNLITSLMRNKLKDKIKDTVDILIKSKKGEELRPKPLLLFCQGSLPIPLLVKYNENGKQGVYNVFVFLKQIVLLLIII